MPKYSVVNESTEDTYASSSNLDDAIRVAREIAGQGPVGDLVCVIDEGGMAVRQFVRASDGAVTEQFIAPTPRAEVPEERKPRVSVA